MRLHLPSLSCYPRAMFRVAGLLKLGARCIRGFTTGQFTRVHTQHGEATPSKFSIQMERYIERQHLIFRAPCATHIRRETRRFTRQRVFEIFRADHYNKNFALHGFVGHGEG